MKQKITIVGAGMSGCFMGLCLAKKGFEVEIYEERPDVREKPYNSGRSFNLTLYYRGILAMQKMGIWDDVKKSAVLAEGNVAHYSNRKAVFDKFDAHGNEVLYTIHRNQLNSTLLNLNEKFPNVKITFNTKFIGADYAKKTVFLEKHGEKLEIVTDIIIGADGVNSTVRSQIKKYAQQILSQEYEDWGYKEVHVSKENAKILNLRKYSTHTWPRPDSLLIAFPNPDESFTLMFNLPLKGKNGFSYLDDPEKVRNYIANHFPDIQPILPEITHAILNKPTGSFITVKTDPWHYKDFLALIGDSAHGVIPFYGQGVSAAFDDCLTLSSLIDEYKEDWEKIFTSYQTERKKQTDILSWLSKENFIELRDKSRSAYFKVKDKTDTFLHRLFPNIWLPPLYILVAHGTLPYSVALSRRKRQERVSRWSGFNIILFAASLPCDIIKKLKGR